jgi:hypothetical protein
METELNRPEAGPALPLLSGLATCLPLPCNGKAHLANTQYQNRVHGPSPHRQFVHSAPP